MAHPASRSPSQATSRSLSSMHSTRCLPTIGVVKTRSIPRQCDALNFRGARPSRSGRASEWHPGSIAKSQFDPSAWIQRLADELEAVATRVKISGSIQHLLGTPPYESNEGDRQWHLSKFRAFAARAKTDPEASRAFDEAWLSLDFDPVQARGMVREHPLLGCGVVGSGSNEKVGLVFLTLVRETRLKELVENLTKLTVRDGGLRAATLLHEFLDAGARCELQGHEILLLHGLDPGARRDLGPDAYLAPYRDAQLTFDLPDTPEKWITDHFGGSKDADATSVLVRGLTWGPAVAPTAGAGGVIESEHQFILHHAVMWEEEDVDMLPGLLEEAQAAYPDLSGCSFDKGFYSPSNRRQLDERLQLNAMPRKGRLSKADRERETAPDFVAARREHAAVESAIHNLEQRGFERVLAHGPEGFARMVALSVLAANVHRIGVLLQRRARERLKRGSLARAA